ncbi:hypothetical protein TUSST3_82430 [Streptomyces sp. TUS-ST3]|uniref:hypothetical protein n=1 Tax=Streptomyces sp. TUS-ST3 TaxID=3025591 RepID=UPI00235B5693|nr:hypothetical protein [Streptomyces sp. TUS-ST3]GLP71624.1 hypothetical protein TUSST3_82430 [Streptomyces sp. TUS-ST3]
MKTYIPSARHAVGALTCAIALVSLTACTGDSGAAKSAAGPTPSQAAKASPAAEPNGIEKLSAKEIYDTGMKTNAEAGSFREKMERNDTTSDLRLSATECAGAVEISEKGSFEIIRKGNDIWAKPDTTFAEGMNSALGKQAFSSDKWTHGTPNNALMAKLASWCHQEQFTAPDTLDAGSKATKGKVTTVNGQPAVAVVLAEKGESVTWYVATTGKPHFIKQDSTRDDMQDLTDSDFGTSVGAKAPSGAVLSAPDA